MISSLQLILILISMLFLIIGIILNNKKYIFTFCLLLIAFIIFGYTALTSFNLLNSFCDNSELSIICGESINFDEGLGYLLSGLSIICIILIFVYYPYNADEEED